MGNTRGPATSLRRRRDGHRAEQRGGQRAADLCSREQPRRTISERAAPRPHPGRPAGPCDRKGGGMTTSEQISQDASLASVATGEALRAGEVALAVFVGLLVCPPLAILVVVVAVPLLLTGLVLGLLAAV